MVLVKRCKKLIFSNFRSRKIFATVDELSYCSENFVPAPAFLLQNKNKNKRTIKMKILKKILIKN